jgi:CRISPR-associated protein Cas1
MIRRTIEISHHPAHLSVKYDQLRIERRDYDGVGPADASAPCEDIGVLIVDHGQVTFTQQALARLMHHGATAIICGPDHLPAGILLPVSTNTETVSRLTEQIQSARPIGKRLWKQIIQAKIDAQRSALPGDPAEKLRLRNLRPQVRSGDPTNVEAQAAKSYWAGWRRVEPKFADFRRDPDGEDPANTFLNYGYAVLRAAMGRAIVAAGLHPAISLHHRHRANAFALADDLIEPLRPIIDRRAFRLVADGATELNRDSKAALLEALTETVDTEDQTGPLMVALHRYIASLVDCFGRRRDRLVIPMAAEHDEPWS